MLPETEGPQYAAVSFGVRTGRKHWWRLPVDTAFGIAVIKD